MLLLSRNEKEKIERIQLSLSPFLFFCCCIQPLFLGLGPSSNFPDVPPAPAEKSRKKLTGSLLPSHFLLVDGGRLG